MVFLGGLRIKTVSLLGNLTLAALAIVCAVTAVLSIDRVGDRLAFTADNSVPSILGLADASSSIDDARLLMAKHLLASTPPATEKIERDLQAKIREVDAALARYKPLVSDAQEQVMFDKVNGLWLQWKEVSQSIRQLSVQTRKEEASAKFNGDLNPIGAALNAAVDTEMAYNSKLGHDSGADGKAIVATSRYLSLGLGTLAAIGALAVIALFLHRLVRPLGSIVAAMDDMAGGNLDREVPFRDNRDEMGDIARALDAIKAGVERRARDEAAVRMAVQQQIVTALAEGLAGLKDGRLTAHIDVAFPAEYEVLRRDFNDALAALAATVGDVTQAAHNVRIGSSEIASAAGDLSGRTESQAAALEESAAALRQLTQNVAETARTAGEASTTARDTQREAASGGEIMVHAVTAMEEIAQSSMRMEAIVALIDGIAFQTNLLALNAGVEAARAGDAGRGFAVVASEVRSLAQRSAEAAKEITGIIKASGRDVANGVQMIGQTQTSLNQIAERTARLSDLIQSIASATEEQSSAILQVNAVVSDMDRITQQNAALVEESTAASRNLANQATNLGGLVERFDLGATGQPGLAHRRLAA